MTNENESIDRLLAQFAGDPRVSVGTGFGRNRGLRVNGRIFAIFMADALTVKLPRARVDELVESGHGARFDPGHGRLMRAWLTVGADLMDDWPGLADEAFRHVSGDEARR
jgi:hypothetical protein